MIIEKYLNIYRSVTSFVALFSCEPQQSSDQNVISFWGVGVGVEVDVYISLS